MTKGILSLDFLDSESFPYPQDPTGSPATQRRISRVLNDVISRELTSRQRECVQMYYFERIPQSEIARKLGISVSAVSRHLTRAKARIEPILRYVGR